MGESKRRKQLLGDAYGSQLTLEKCPIPAKISFGYVSDEALASNEAKLHKMSDDFKSAFSNALIKAQDTQQPGIIFSEALKFSGGVGVQISLRDDIETFIKSRCQNQSLALRIIQKLLWVDYKTYRVIAFLDGSDIPKLAINVYSLEQIATLLNYLNMVMGSDA